jgi:hypothetical protein
MTVSEREAYISAAVGEIDVDGVLRWRYDELVAAGYRALDAARLARARSIDLHLAVDLLRRGCDPETALRILF